MNPTASENSFSYLALGDSYTIGESVTEAQRWPVQLVTRLRREGLPMAEPVIIARTGWTTADLLRASQAQANTESYDLVSVLAGVNDQYRGYSLEEYRAKFAELLALAITAAGGDQKHVIVLSIPDWGVTPFAEGRDRERIAAEIDAFNAVNREESALAGVQYFEITPISRQVADDDDLIAYDGLHPSGEMYSAWVDVVFNYVHNLLADE